MPGYINAHLGQALVDPRLVDSLSPTTALWEVQARKGATPTCEEELLLMQQASTLPSSTGQYIRLRVADRVCVVELNDPSHFNALSPDMASDMQMAVQWIATQEPGSIKSVVLQGAGDHFCPGGNMYKKQAPASSFEAFARSSLDLFDGFCQLRTLPVPV
eukprot:5607786-Prymnesium_polylepis.1